MILFLKKFSLTFIPLSIIIACSGLIDGKKNMVTSIISDTIENSKTLTTDIPALVKTISIKTGADNFQQYLPLLKDKKIGVVTNQSGILADKTHLVDFLLSKNIKIQGIFAPEHGFRGTADAGEPILDGKDAKTGLSIISLYGDNKKPKAAQLVGIDIVVFDLQDVGARFYTYISSLHYIMEACAENNIQLLILDRPNPNGNIVDALF